MSSRIRDAIGNGKKMLSAVPIFSGFKPVAEEACGR